MFVDGPRGRSRDLRTADLTPYRGNMVWVAWRNNSDDQFIPVVNDIKVFCN
ncbi:hypothetical protein AKJ09_06805 [Labilithrix luteola]|uniref:Uncharacterized protein n=1 Tax=Labilithrix luteola TaxID=1391654 RepID=A0A0K1Q3D0_9BACT|nr:hypothetical protein AKJ09_06805 [Labilithrix luteola]